MAVGKGQPVRYLDKYEFARADRLDPKFLDIHLRSLIRIEPFTEAQAVIAAQLRPATKHLGLSLADRVCLGLAIQGKMEVYTADAKWSEMPLGCKVHLIR